MLHAKKAECILYSQISCDFHLGYLLFAYFYYFKFKIIISPQNFLTRKKLITEILQNVREKIKLVLCIWLHKLGLCKPSLCISESQK